MERLLDRAAERLNLGRDEIRRRNLIQPENMPYTRPLASRADPSVVIDEADFPKCMETALRISRWDDFPARQSAAARRSITRNWSFCISKRIRPRSFRGGYGPGRTIRPRQRHIWRICYRARNTHNARSDRCSIPWHGN